MALTLRTSRAYYVTMTPLSANPQGFLVKVTLSPDRFLGTPWKTLYVGPNAIVHHGLMNFNPGDEVEVTFDNKDKLYRMDFVAPGNTTSIKKTLRHPTSGRAVYRAIPVSDGPAPGGASPAPAAPAKAVIKRINYCQRGMMHTCGAAKDRDKRNICRFCEPSIGRYNDCMHYRETFGHVCASVDAQQDLVNTLGAPPPPKQPEEPEVGWDEATKKLSF
jgi:hypothetical protein